MARSVTNNYSNKPKFGQIVAVQLCAMGKNQKWLAAQCSVTQSHISMVLAGKANPSNSLLYEIANSIGVESSTLINALFEAS
jgi:transcriptional regulator with XRE-family HTH domain